MFQSIRGVKLLPGYLRFLGFTKLPVRLEVLPYDKLPVIYRLKTGNFYLLRTLLYIYLCTATVTLNIAYAYTCKTLHIAVN
jgi:hypothetical protein